MTRPQTLSVEYDELMARADEMEQPLPAIPSTNPPAPCALSYANSAAAQLALSADSIRLYLTGCQREWKRLAKSLRNAAKAYREVDEGAADSMHDEVSAQASIRGGAGLAADGDFDQHAAWTAPPPVPPPAPFDDQYYEVRRATMDIEAGDQGAACQEFAHDWDAFQRALQRVTYRFRPFNSWEGDARTAVEQNFELHRQWILSMVNLCCTLRDQAMQIVDAQKQLRAPTGLAARDENGNYLNPEEHPGPVDVSTCDTWYADAVRLNLQDWVDTAINWYAKMQVQSEGALKLYSTNTSLVPLNPSMFPTAAAVVPGNSDGDRGLPTDGLPWDDGLLDPSDMPMAPEAGMPTTPSMPTMPTAPQTPADAMAGKSSAATALRPSTGSGVKAASLGGGGIGGGAPSAPLQPWAVSDGASGPSGAGPGAAAAGLGRGLPGAGGGMGGGMGGMAPMGPGGRDENGKGKRVQSDEQALYTERRAWTEGIIGQRRQNSSRDK
ncbi:hypothetical protein KXD96_04160 [Mycobacterium sp. SMC-2]|uniref:PPE domain-containing protein n=1 Tax=Mycobacterium sp. SMC-2 TaxID=2857058 RepID=UPI0021B33BFA|nr:hypothetical protein [Mycobacterium sp. SMC-2]UXA07346.1 hypothetical protein KXD96_04160 [Mycobacterium sp. SMC-2]